MVLYYGKFSFTFITLSSSNTCVAKMQSRFLQSLLSNSVRSIPKYRIPTTVYFYPSIRNVSQTEESWKNSISEKRKDFSDLNPNEFGSLNPTVRVNEMLDRLPAEQGDNDEYDILDEQGKKVRRRLEYYEDLVEKLLDKNKLVEALDVLETRMLKTDRVKPGFRIYNLLINGCAKVGYTQKAFQLYKSMKDRKIKRTPSTYTGLFNACANSLFPEDALTRLNHLRKRLAENGVELNAINYHAMIKAYARLKETHAAFLVADEMLNKGFSLQPRTCCFLLQACISDTECGLRHALLVWHKMRQKGVNPNVFHYNLLLRCVNLCGLGDEKELKDVIQKIVQTNHLKMIGAEDNNMKLTIGMKNEPENNSEKITIRWKNKTTSVNKSTNKVELAEEEPSQMKIIGDIVNENVSAKYEELQKINRDYSERKIIENRPNLLAKNPHLGNIIAVKMVDTPSDRLLLLGGYKTILEQMEEDKIEPDIKTFTQLLEVMPPSVEAENRLLEEVKKHKIDIDTTFCNVLMKQRALRNDFNAARQVISLLQTNYLQPDIVTFGIMAMSCCKQYEAEELIDNMEAFGYRMNMEILGAMLKKALFKCNFPYALFILQFTSRIRLQPSQQFMDMLDNSEKKMTDLFRRKKRKDPKVPQFFHDAKFLENYRMFREYYMQWKKKVTVFVPPNPLEQFKKPHSEKAHASDTEETEGESEMIENETKNRKWKENNFKERKVYPKKFNSFDRAENEDRRKFKPKKFVSKERKINSKNVHNRDDMGDFSETEWNDNDENSLSQNEEEQNHG